MNRLALPTVVGRIPRVSANIAARPTARAAAAIGGRRLTAIASSLLVGLTLVLSACGEEAATTTTSAPGAVQIKTPHFVDSYPNHEDIFAQTPELVVINFDFDLGGQSTIAVTLDDTGVTAGPTEVFNDSLSMRVPLKDGRDGLYQVSYTAYWPDGTNHDGSFSFTIDSTTRSTYNDLTGQSAVAIDMAALAFQPARIIISQGTTVTWTNKENVEHFVNTDPHPSHNALPELNSRGLMNGDAYSFTFTQAGEWGYHCSAHYPHMVGRIIVVPASAGSTTTFPATTTSASVTTTVADVAGPPLSDVKHLRTPHFVDSTPTHGTTMAIQPNSILITFNFDLGGQSTIAVTRADVDVTAGKTTIAGDRLSMSVPLKAGSGRGTYLVKYRAYWPDGTYHDGQFAFAVG